MNEAKHPLDFSVFGGLGFLNFWLTTVESRVLDFPPFPFGPRPWTRGTVPAAKGVLGLVAWRKARKDSGIRIIGYCRFLLGFLIRAGAFDSTEHGIASPGPTSQTCLRFQVSASGASAWSREIYLRL